MSSWAVSAFSCCDTMVLGGGGGEGGERRCFFFPPLLPSPKIRVDQYSQVGTNLMQIMLHCVPGDLSSSQ